MEKYFSTSSIGSGSCGAVQIVYDNEGQCYAMKTFEEDEDDTLAIETIRELAVMHMLQHTKHPNIVHMVETLTQNEELCFVMPKFDLTLQDAIRGKLLKGHKLKITHGLISAVAHIHENGFMHRDIKPDNILLTHDLQPVLIDFGMTTTHLSLIHI